MKRRNFLKQLPVAMSIPFTIGGIPLKIMEDNPLVRLAGDQRTGEKVLIILQMHGGNDGLNSLIPVEAYDQYYSRRPNIAIPAKNSLRKYIPLDSTLPSDVQVGLHPDMKDMKAMYDRGAMTFVQGVSYKNNNGSHFRGRDIWFMGGGYDDYFDSGWVGRYLQQQYAPKSYPKDFPVVDDPNYPDMPDPLAIEMGSDISLIFHQSGNIPTSISINDPENFKDLIEELQGFKDATIDSRGFPPDFLNPSLPADDAASPYWKEMDWILKLEDKSKAYAQTLYDEWLAGSKLPAVDYPDKYPYNAPSGSLHNPLSAQLKLIANLLAGGCKTRVFMVKIGGFDTHANQVESYDATMGGHAALMYHISSAMKAFQEDLKKKGQGLADRVLTVSTSEFGRRVHSNGSFGTDHGTGGPIYIFGNGATPGVVGKVPDLSKDNVEMQFDYRRVYADILLNWMMTDDPNAKTKLTNDIFFKNFIDGPDVDDSTKPDYTPLNLATTIIAGTDDFIKERIALNNCYPNPAKDKTTLHFRVNSTSDVSITLMDSQGRHVKTLINKEYEAGEYREHVDLTGLQTGSYIYQMKTLFFKESKKLVIVK